MLDTRTTHVQRNQRADSYGVRVTAQDACASSEHLCKSRLHDCSGSTSSLADKDPRMPVEVSIENLGRVGMGAWNSPCWRSP